jgi:hypothetical protein
MRGLFHLGAGRRNSDQPSRLVRRLGLAFKISSASGCEPGKRERDATSVAPLCNEQTRDPCTVIAKRVLLRGISDEHEDARLKRNIQ